MRSMARASANTGVPILAVDAIDDIPRPGAVGRQENLALLHGQGAPAALERFTYHPSRPSHAACTVQFGPCFRIRRPRLPVVLRGARRKAVWAAVGSPTILGGVADASRRNSRSECSPVDKNTLARYMPEPSDRPRRGSQTRMTFIRTIISGARLPSTSSRCRPCREAPGFVAPSEGRDALGRGCSSRREGGKARRLPAADPQPRDASSRTPRGRRRGSSSRPGTPQGRTTPRCRSHKSSRPHTCPRRSSRSSRNWAWRRSPRCR
jgi:hypothetical protein